VGGIRRLTWGPEKKEGREKVKSGAAIPCNAKKSDKKDIKEGSRHQRCLLRAAKGRKKINNPSQRFGKSRGKNAKRSAKAKMGKKMVPGVIPG